MIARYSMSWETVLIIKCGYFFCVFITFVFFFLKLRAAECVHHLKKFLQLCHMKQPASNLVCAHSWYMQIFVFHSLSHSTVNWKKAQLNNYCLSWLISSCLSTVYFRVLCRYYIFYFQSIFAKAFSWPN